MTKHQLLQNIQSAKKPRSRPNGMWKASQAALGTEQHPRKPHRALGKLRSGVETLASHTSCPVLLSVPSKLPGHVLDPVGI